MAKNGEEPSQRHYRALISVSLTAADEDAAWEQASDYALSLTGASGHLEVIGETREDGTARVTYEGRTEWDLLTHLG